MYRNLKNRLSSQTKQEDGTLIIKSIVFVDIRGFTKACENAPLLIAIKKLLTKFFLIIEKHFYEDEKKYLGDGAMIITSKPIEVILNKIYTIRNDFTNIMNKFKNDIGVNTELNLGIGITKGALIEIDRRIMDFLSIKDYVSPRINLSARLCSFAKPFGIIIHKESFNELPNKYKEDFSLTVIKNVPGLENQVDLRCWVERSIDILEKDDVRIQKLNIEAHVTALVFNQEGKLLLCKRSKDREILPLKWSSPGGKVLPNCSFDESIKAIFRREVDVEIDYLKPIDTYFITQYRIPGLIFWGEIIDGTPKNNDGQSMEVKLFEKEEIYPIQEELVPTIEIIENAFKIYENQKKFSIRLRIILSTECNYSCKYCHNEHIDKNVNLDTNQIKKTLKELMEKFILSHLTISGGEPFYKGNCDNLLSLLSYLREELHYDKKISIVTNATCLNEDIILKIKKFDVSLKISLYNLSNIRNDYMGIGYDGYYNSIIEQITFLQRAKIKYSITILLMKSTINDIEGFIEDISNKNLNPEEIKLIEMVNPENSDREDFNSEFIKIDDVEFYKGNLNYIVPLDIDFKNKFSLKYKGHEILFYRYPCSDIKNCISCFEKFDLIIPPDGGLQICSRLFSKERNIFQISKLDNIKLKEKNYNLIYFG